MPPSATRRSARCLDELERDLIGLVPVKSRIRDIAALLLVDKLARQRWACPPARRRCT